MLSRIQRSALTRRAMLSGTAAAATTILYQLGLDQDALSHVHLGRKKRLTEVHGEIVKIIIS